MIITKYMRGYIYEMVQETDRCFMYHGVKGALHKA